MAGVYFDQLLGVIDSPILKTLVFHQFYWFLCKYTYFTMGSIQYHFKSYGTIEYIWKQEKMSENAEKSISTSFRVLGAPESCQKYTTLG